MRAMHITDALIGWMLTQINRQIMNILAIATLFTADIDESELSHRILSRVRNITETPHQAEAVKCRR